MVFGLRSVFPERWYFTQVSLYDNNKHIAVQTHVVWYIRHYLGHMWHTIHQKMVTPWIPDLPLFWGFTFCMTWALYLTRLFSFNSVTLGCLNLRVICSFLDNRSGTSHISIWFVRIHFLLTQTCSNGLQQFQHIKTINVSKMNGFIPIFQCLVIDFGWKTWHFF